MPPDTRTEAEAPSGRDTKELTCPHCNRPFSAELLGGDERQRGFKCPHCRLFVPLERAG